MAGRKRRDSYGRYRGTGAIKPWKNNLKGAKSTRARPVSVPKGSHRHNATSGYKGGIKKSNTKRNVALALGGVAVAGGVGYGVYKYRQANAARNPVPTPRLRTSGLRRPTAVNRSTKSLGKGGGLSSVLAKAGVGKTVLGAAKAVARTAAPAPIEGTVKPTTKGQRNGRQTPNSAPVAKPIVPVTPRKTDGSSIIANDGAAAKAAGQSTSVSDSDRSEYEKRVAYWRDIEAAKAAGVKAPALAVQENGPYKAQESSVPAGVNRATKRGPAKPTVVAPAEPPITAVEAKKTAKAVTAKAPTQDVIPVVAIDRSKYVQVGVSGKPYKNQNQGLQFKAAGPPVGQVAPSTPSTSAPNTPVKQTWRQKVAAAQPITAPAALSGTQVAPSASKKTAAPKGTTPPGQVPTKKRGRPKKESDEIGLTPAQVAEMQAKTRARSKGLKAGGPGIVLKRVEPAVQGEKIAAAPQAKAAGLSAAAAPKKAAPQPNSKGPIPTDKYNDLVKKLTGAVKKAGGGNHKAEEILAEKLDQFINLGYQLDRNQRKLHQKYYG